MREIPEKKMKLEIYQVDAFTNKLFSGNPAAVIPLRQWLSDEFMQQIALENNLSDTAFFIPSVSGEADYDIRWFTPAAEINLCGHATLASAYILFNKMNHNKPAVLFNSKSGMLKVEKEKDRFSMDLPAWKPNPLKDYPPELHDALNIPEFVSVYKHRDLLVEVAGEEIVQQCRPDFTLLKKLGEKVILTAKGTTVDIVSRFFAPAVGIDEDPVTGSAHVQLIPYWAEKTGKNHFHALQLSPRGGELWCTLQGGRVAIAGECVFFMQGVIEL